MKKNSVFKWLVITVIFCAVVFSACKSDSDPQRKITVTGIPATHNGRYGIFAFLNATTGDFIAVSYPLVQISNGTAAGMTMYDINSTDDNMIPYTTGGNQFVAFIISDSSGNTFYWQGGIQSKNISGETTTIAFSEFIYVPLSVQQAPLGAKDVLLKALKELTIK